VILIIKIIGFLLMNKNNKIDWVEIIIGLIIYPFGILDIATKNASGGRIDQVYYHMTGNNAIIIGVLIIIISLFLIIEFLRALQNYVHIYSKNRFYYTSLCKKVIIYYLVNPLFIILITLQYGNYMLHSIIMLTYLIFIMGSYVSIYNVYKKLK